ncbi:MAG: hypothetical protein H6607_06770 [Flavobacteriales bacterium]|nr:hypothetical protein [Flavobacteriales bacterium]
MDELAKAVLEQLLFPENFENIVEECRIKAGKHIIGDVLKTLLHDEMVSPMLPNEKGDWVRSLGYDSDFMGDYRYQITAKGLKALQLV